MRHFAYRLYKTRRKLHTTELKIYPDAIEFLLGLRAHCPLIFSSIAIEPTVSVALRRGLKKKPVQSFLISVTPGTRIFKCDYISLYLHNWAVLRLCIVFSIGEMPRVCSNIVIDITYC